MSEIKREHIYTGLILLILFGIFQYGIRRICGFTLYPDEFGYWASAARAVGYDWSEVASIGSYYSFGYSVILFPILKLFSDGVAAYRVAVLVNMLLMCICVFVFGKIMKMLFPMMNSGRSIFISGTAVLYPAWIFYAQMTMTEGLLFSLFAFTTYLLLKALKEPKIGTLMTLGGVLVYLYCVHMRTIGVVIACVFTWVLWTIAGGGSRKKLLAFLGVCFFMGAGAALLKECVIDEVFSYADRMELAANDYGNQWEKLADIFTISGGCLFLREMAGKLFYLGLSSYSLFYWALGWCVKESVEVISFLFQKRGQEIEQKKWLAVFLLLASLAQIMISSIYMHRGSFVDGLIYGRYNEFLVPVMMLVGLYAMSESRWKFPVTLLLGTTSGCMIPMLLDVIERGKMSGIRGYHIAGLSCIFDETKGSIPVLFKNVWLFGFGMMLFVCILVSFSQRWKGSFFLLSGIFLIEIVTGLRISENYTYRANSSNYESMVLVDFLQEERRQKEQLFYIDEGEPAFVDFIQMQMKDRSIRVREAKEFEPEKVQGGIVITAGETFFDKQLKNCYKGRLETDTFWLYYN